MSHEALPANAFDCNAPHLRRLRLEDTLIPFESPIYENLAHLHLGHLTGCDRHRGSPPFTREQLLALLHRMPNLESLKVEAGVIPDKSPNVEDSEDDARVPLSPTPAPVALASLQMLELRESQPKCVWMVSQLSFPATASIMVTPRGLYEEYEEASVRAFLHLLMRHLGTWDCVQPTQTISIKLSHRSWRFLCWKEIIDSDIDPRKTYRFDYIGITSWVEDESKLPCCNVWSESDGVAIDVLETLVRPVLSEAATCNIRVLDICGAELQIGCSDWLASFTSSTALESLTLGDTVLALNFVQVFGLDLALNLDTFSTAGDTPHTLFPSLRVLTFREVDFKRFVDTADAKLSELMTESLTERLTINATLEEIRLIRCKWSQHWINAVRRIGPKVFCEVPLSWKGSRGRYE